MSITGVQVERHAPSPGWRRVASDAVRAAARNGWTPRVDVLRDGASIAGTSGSEVLRLHRPDIPRAGPPCLPLWTLDVNTPAMARLPNPAEIAAKEVAAALGAEGGSLTVLAPAEDGARGIGPIDAVDIGAGLTPGDGALGGWTIEYLRTAQTRCWISRIHVRLESRAAAPEVMERLQESSRIRLVPAWMNLTDTARLSEHLRDVGADGDRWRETVTSPQWIRHPPGRTCDWVIWTATGAGAVAAVLAEAIGRVAHPLSSPPQIRAAVDAALRSSVGGDRA